MVTMITKLCGREERGRWGGEDGGGRGEEGGGGRGVEDEGGRGGEVYSRYKVPNPHTHILTSGPQ